MYFFYNVLLLLVYPLLYLVSRFSTSLKNNFKIRRIALRIDAGNRPVIWFHAASVGEYEQARVVAQTLKQRHPHIFLFFTVYSYSGYSQRQNDPLPDVLYPLPFDFSWRMNKLLNKIHPQIIVYAKYDVWPNLARLAAKKSIPQVLISATLPEKSNRRRGIGRYFFAKVYRHLNAILTIHDLHTARYVQLGINAQTAGDTRFDAAAQKIQQSGKNTLEIISQLRKALAPKKMVLVAGSTYATSEKMLAQTLSLRDNLDVFAVIAPHHVNEVHITQIEQLLVQHKLCYQRFTQLQKKKINFKNDQVLLIDTTGVLPYLYELGDIAYIGGGFEGSLHSVLEPAYFGLPLCSGPAIANSQEALDLNKQGLLHILSQSSSNDLNSFLQKAFDTKWYKTQQKKIKSYYQLKQGATKTIVSLIEKTAQFFSFTSNPTYEKKPPQRKKT